MNDETIDSDSVQSLTQLINDLVELRLMRSEWEKAGLKLDQRTAIAITRLVKARQAIDDAIGAEVEKASYR